MASTTQQRYPFSSRNFDGSSEIPEDVEGIPLGDGDDEDVEPSTPVTLQWNREHSSVEAELKQRDGVLNCDVLLVGGSQVASCFLSACLVGELEWIGTILMPVRGGDGPIRQVPPPSEPLADLNNCNIFRRKESGQQEEPSVVVLLCPCSVSTRDEFSWKTEVMSKLHPRALVVYDSLLPGGGSADSLRDMAANLHLLHTQPSAVQSIATSALGGVALPGRGGGEGGEEGAEAEGEAHRATALSQVASSFPPLSSPVQLAGPGAALLQHAQIHGIPALGLVVRVSAEESEPVAKALELLAGTGSAVGEGILGQGGEAGESVLFGTEALERCRKGSSPNGKGGVGGVTVGGAGGGNGGYFEGGLDWMNLPPPRAMDSSNMYA